MKGTFRTMTGTTQVIFLCFHNILNHLTLDSLCSTASFTALDRNYLTPFFTIQNDDEDDSGNMQFILFSLQLTIKLIFLCTFCTYVPEIFQVVSSSYELLIFLNTWSPIYVRFIVYMCSLAIIIIKAFLPSTGQFGYGMELHIKRAPWWNSTKFYNLPIFLLT